MTPNLESGAVFAERYRIEGAIAAGGYGRVYRGRHLVLDAPVAIKILRPERFAEAVDRRAEVDSFLREARMLARMRHPNIVEVLDAGVSADTELPWMVLAWCDGKTLADLLATNAVPVPMSPVEAWRLLRPAAQAIEYAHAQGITHRDIKPANLMLVPENGALSPRVLDFGIAKASPSRGVQPMQSPGNPTGSAGFTPGYAAPEQVAAMPSGPWTDVHALALLFTELVTGQPPYEMGMAFVSAVSPSRPSPAAFQVDVGPAIERVLARALSLDASARPANAGQLITELDAAIGGTPPALSSRRAPPRASRAPGASGFTTGASIGTSATMAAPFHPGVNTTAPHSLPLPANTVGAVPYTPFPSAAPTAAARPTSRASSVIIAFLAVLVLGGAGAAIWYFASAGDRTASHESKSKKPKSSKSRADDDPTATADSAKPPSYPPKATIHAAEGSIMKDRKIPKYDATTLATAIDKAGYRHEPIPGADSPGYKLVVYKITRAPCGGSVQFYEVSSIDPTLAAMRKAVDPKYLIAQDENRGLLVALDTIPDGANADCMGDVLGQLTTPR